MNHERLKSYELLMEFAKKMPNILNRLPKGNAYLEDQLKRAFSSAALNVAEGNGRTSKRERNRFFDFSIGSIAEVSSIMDLFMAYGYISRIESIESKNLLNRAIWYLGRLKDAI